MMEERNGRADPSEGATGATDTGIDAAEARLTRAGVAFSASLREASVAGRETVERFAWAARPLLIGAGILAGGVVVARLWRGTRQPQVRRLPAAQPAARQWPALARSLAFALAAMAVRRLTARWLGQPPRRA
jgi:hypothetical protein